MRRFSHSPALAQMRTLLFLLEKCLTSLFMLEVPSCWSGAWQGHFSRVIAVIGLQSGCGPVSLYNAVAHRLRKAHSGRLLQLLPEVIRSLKLLLKLL